MYVVLVYDVVADRRRNRLHRRLHGFLHAVQYSVFEGPLPERRWDELVRVVRREIRPELDSVRIYPLCRTCRGMMTLMGTSPAIGDGHEPIVV